MFLACSGLVAERDPLPDAEAWRAIEDPRERLRVGLRDVYDWYERNAELVACVLRDAEYHALTKETAELNFGPPMAAYHEVLGRKLSTKQRAVLRLGLSFFTWRTLVRGSGLKQGAQLAQSRARLPAKGYWYPPSFFTGVTASHRIAQEEIFGPVLSVMTFRTPEEAIARANNTPYGLSAGVWTDKGSKIFKIVNQLRAGVVWANTYNKFDPASPFGGYKESGFGREGGLQGLAAYCRFD